MFSLEAEYCIKNETGDLETAIESYLKLMSQERKPEIYAKAIILKSLGATDETKIKNNWLVDMVSWNIKKPREE